MVKNADGLFVVNGGYAKLEDKTPVRDNMTAWLYSISKTYLATVALKLQEKGLLKLDTVVSAYISADVMKHLAQLGGAAGVGAGTGFGALHELGGHAGGTGGNGGAQGALDQTNQHFKSERRLIGRVRTGFGFWPIPLL